MNNTLLICVILSAAFPLIAVGSPSETQTDKLNIKWSGRVPHTIEVVYRNSVNLNDLESVKSHVFRLTPHHTTNTKLLTLAL